MNIAKSTLLSTFFLLACSSDGSLNRVTIKLTNNNFSPAETSSLYKNQDIKILDINKCKGSPSTGNAATCTSGTSDFGVYYVTNTPAVGNKLPDSTTLEGIAPGFYWANFLFYRNDPDNGCQISTANGVFEIETEKTTTATFEVGIPHSCDQSPCADSETACDGVCADLNTDVDNCGACGNECDSGEMCAAGECLA